MGAARGYRLSRFDTDECVWVRSVILNRYIWHQIKPEKGAKGWNLNSKILHRRWFINQFNYSFLNILFIRRSVKWFNKCISKNFSFHLWAVSFNITFSECCPTSINFLCDCFLYKLYIKCLVTSKISFIFDLLIMYFCMFYFIIFYISFMYLFCDDWLMLICKSIFNYWRTLKCTFLILSFFLFFEGVIFFYHFLITSAFKFHFFVFQIQTMLDKKI